jgi:hypothetical protein
MCESKRFAEMDIPELLYNIGQGETLLAAEELSRRGFLNILPHLDQVFCNMNAILHLEDFSNDEKQRAQKIFDEICDLLWEKIIPTRQEKMSKQQDLIHLIDLSPIYRERAIEMLWEIGPTLFSWAGCEGGLITLLKYPNTHQEDVWKILGDLDLELVASENDSTPARILAWILGQEKIKSFPDWIWEKLKASNPTRREIGIVIMSCQDAVIRQEAEEIFKNM